MGKILGTEMINLGVLGTADINPGAWKKWEDVNESALGALIFFF